METLVVVLLLFVCAIVVAIPFIFVYWLYWKIIKWGTRDLYQNMIRDEQSK